MKKIKINKRIIAGCLCLCCIIVMLTGCDLLGNNTSESTEPMVDLSTYDGMVAASVLQYPATNTYFRYNVYTYYVTISELLTTNTTVTIPETIEGLPVIAIEPDAFKNRTSIKTLYIGNHVATIGRSAFSNCINLETVTLPPSLTLMGAEAFSYCTNLKNITIPSKLQNIPSNAFNGCSALFAINIEESDNADRVIESGAFSYCPALRYAWIPQDVIEISKDAFTKSLDNVTIYGYAASQAAVFSAQNLIDFTVLNKSSFRSMVASVMANVPRYPSVGESVISPTWSITLQRVEYVQSLGALQAAEHHTFVILHFSILNTTKTTLFFNGLNTLCRVNNYTKPLTFVDSAATNAPFLARQVMPMETLEGCLVYEVSQNFRYLTVDFSALDGFSTTDAILAVYPD